MKQEKLIQNFKKIREQLGYSKEWKPSFLFQELNKSNYSMEEKIGFILYCYGWNGCKRTVLDNFSTAKEYCQFMFDEGKCFIEQFDGLILPCKSSSSKSGSHILLKFLWNPVIMTGISAHFSDQVIPIGVMRCFDGYEDENGENCWEDITIPPDDLTFDTVSLYLGKSGNVYWFCYDGDSLGIAANSLLEFFSIQFSFVEDIPSANTKWTEADLKQMRNDSHRD